MSVHVHGRLVTAKGVRDFARAILHGDEKHRKWLLDAAESFISGEPIRGVSSGLPAAVESKEQKERRYYDAFRAWFMQSGCDFWSECDAPESLATIAVEIAPAADRSPPIPREAMPRLFDRDGLQELCVGWGIQAFGEEHMRSIPQLAVRFLEEAIELYQAASGDLDMAHRLLDFVFNRPVGTIESELGGVGVTALALAAAAGLSADKCERKEIARVLSKDPGEFAKRNHQKNEAGFNVVEPKS